MDHSPVRSVPLGDLLLQCCQDEKLLHHGTINQMPTVRFSLSDNRASVVIRFPDLQEIDDYDFSVTPATHTHRPICLGTP
jgi:hypothetical protein